MFPIKEKIKEWYEEGRLDGKLWLVIIKEIGPGGLEKDSYVYFYYPSDQSPIKSFNQQLTYISQSPDLQITEIYSLEYPLEDET